MVNVSVILKNIFYLICCLLPTIRQKPEKSLLKCTGFCKSATPPKKKLANKPHNSNRCWAQQIYQQLGKLSEPKSTEQEENLHHSMIMEQEI